jgi:hypothetical protein
VKLGKCAKCGKILVRFQDVDVAVCTCSSVVEVPLTVTISRSQYETAKQLAKEMATEEGKDYKKTLQGLLNDYYEIETEVEAQKRIGQTYVRRACVY